MAKETRVRWNDEEKAQLIAAARQTLALKPMRPLAALAAAQRVLPKDRQRSVTQAGKVAWFVKGVNSPAAAVPASAVGARGIANGDAVALVAQGLAALVSEAVERGIALALQRQSAPGRGGSKASARPARGKAHAKRR